ncbi:MULTISPECIES: cyclic nucleotide-binding domain-containing protein [Thiothrix]|jgi:CRP-like cAMP-binding protein|uniref:Cyclic nucleotide-binding domain-containing protein n=1 Tax=Thiothrix unzii TaxID=111769 RepID=A0A975II07_9GAMM|nr:MULTISPECIES: cyclic nucleotide-binding domain-containing protein [Thiothrix]QTR53225.1 cyclic nucleotide-binding domain-containing protein [Thiothrix unzii]
MAVDIYRIILLLKSSSVFSQVSTDDLRQVALAMEEERYLVGEHIFDQGQFGDHMYVLQAGRVGISLRTGNRSECLAELGAGECFGEMNLLDDLPRSATAYALEDVIVFALEKQRLRQLILRCPELSLGIMRSLSLRLRDANLRNA